MKYIALFLLMLSVTAFAEGPEPAPWWKNVEDTQSLLIKWAAALTVVGTAIITAAATLYGLLNSKIREIKERQDRASAEKVVLQSRVIDLAQQSAPPSISSPMPVVMTNTPDNAANVHEVKTQ